MLKLLRHKNVTKIVLWGILILIMPAFVIWGTGNIGGSKDKGPKYVGTIKKKKVSFDDFARAVNAMRSQLILNYFNQPQAVEAVLKNQEFLGKLAWDRIIMSREAKARRIKIPNKDLVAHIKSHPLFLRGGIFDDKIYNYFLKYNLSLDPRTFEEIVRENLAIQKMNDDLTKDVKATDEEVREAYGKENARFKISYVFFPAAPFSDKTEVTEDEIKNYYEIRKEDFAVQTKEAEAKDAVKKYLRLDEAKPAIKTIIAEMKAVPLAKAKAGEEREKIKEAMDKEKRTFAYACKNLGLEAQETPLFSGSDTIEGIGEMRLAAEEASRLKTGEVSQAVETSRGACFFTVDDTQPFDEEKLKKEKDEYAKKVLTSKKNKFLEDWLRRLESESELKINLSEYEKYYR